MQNTSKKDSQINTLTRACKGIGQRFTKAERRQMKARFFAAFCRSGNVSQSCRSIGINRSLVGAWCRSDPTFARKMRQINAALFSFEWQYATPDERRQYLRDRAAGYRIVKYYYPASPVSKPSDLRTSGGRIRIALCNDHPLPEDWRRRIEEIEARYTPIIFEDE